MLDAFATISKFGLMLDWVETEGTFDSLGTPTTHRDKFEDVKIYFESLRV